MPTIDVVRISEIRKHVADVIEQVHLGVEDARKNGRQAELPSKLDFQMNVIVEWQALEVTNSETGTTKDGGSTTEVGTSNETVIETDDMVATERQTGWQKNTESGATTTTQTGTETKRADSTNSHVNNGTETTTTEEA